MNLNVAFILVLLTTSLTCQAQSYSGEYSKYKVYKNLKKALQHKSRVKILHLQDKGLDKFPVEILELKELRVLNLYKNNIKEIPNDIDQLKKLERLELMKNKLSTLPESIVNLKKLKRINLAYNGMSDQDVQFVKEAFPDCFIITAIIL
ncbi:MAG: leucine-rich repeat domain-containing protein [Bacteroidota bacterium]